MRSHHQWRVGWQRLHPAIVQRNHPVLPPRPHVSITGPAASPPSKFPEDDALRHDVAGSPWRQGVLVALVVEYARDTGKRFANRCGILEELTIDDQEPGSRLVFIHSQKIGPGAELRICRFD